jgi:hypothetical protein
MRWSVHSLAEICRTSGPLCVTAGPTDAMDRTTRAHAADKPEINVIVALMLPNPARIQMQCVEIGTKWRLPRD